MMKIDKIFEEWDADTNFDKTELGDEALKVSKLHHKYFRILTQERITRRSLEAEMKVLRLEKFEFYTQGPSKESVERGWQMPPIGKVVKSEVNNYMEADRDIIDISLKIGIQSEKIDLLESIIKTILSRGYNIKAAIDWEKFKMGAG
jgi:hypothetical protein